MKISEYVTEFDPQNQFQILKDTYKQIEFAWNNQFNVESLKGKKYNSILVSGLGGSAIAGDLMCNFLKDELKVPLIVNRNYKLPLFVNENTLVIVSSYSGNTEETVSVLQQAIEKKCSIVAITTGGKIEELSLKAGVPVVKTLPGFQPRYALGVSFFSLLKVLQELGFIEDQTSAVNDIIECWKKQGEELSAEDNPAFNMAKEMDCAIPFIYSYADFNSAAGYRFKCQFNENSKLHAFANVIPELNHNEIIGWEMFDDSDHEYVLITIVDKDYPEQIKKRFQITTELCEESNINCIELEGSMPAAKLRLMEIIYFCDWVTYYAAVLDELDPTEIENINILKERLAE